MSAGILKEADILVRSLFMGVILVFVYDLLRIIRRIIPHGKWPIAVEDFLFWGGSAIAVFAMLFSANDGYLRGFSIGGVVIGMLLNNLLLSRFVVKGSVFVLEKILYIILKPLALLIRIFRRPLHMLAKKIKKIIRIIKKQLKKIGKAVRIGIYKK